jgi:hypothetical protein
MKNIKWLYLIFVVILVVSCAHAPKWITKGSGAFPKENKIYFYGVGVSVLSRNPAMEREKAEHRARVEIARIIKTYVTGLTKDFMEEYPDFFETEAWGSEEYTSRVSKEVVDATLHGCEIIDHYLDKKTNSFYALARMPKDTVDSSIKERMRMMKGLLLKAKVNEALKELDRELKKMDNREDAKWKRYFPAPTTGEEEE